MRVTHPSGDDPHHDSRRDHDTMHLRPHDVAAEQDTHRANEKDEVYPWAKVQQVHREKTRDVWLAVKNGLDHRGRYLGL